MNLKERLDGIKELETIETPWEVKRIFGQIQLFGSQISVYGSDSNDFVDSQEFRDALAWLVMQMNGKVTWNKEKKSETKTR